MDVFLQIHVEGVLQQSRETVIVLRRYDDETVAALDRRRKFRVLHLLTSVIELHRQRTHIDEFRFHAGALFCLLKNKPRSVFAFPALPGGAEDHWNKKRAFHLLDRIYRIETIKEIRIRLILLILSS